MQVIRSGVLQAARLGLGLALTLLSPVHAAAWDLDSLMRSLAAHKSGRASFTERKFIALLDEPVDSSGELSFTAPDRLEKRTLKPKPETMLVDGGSLTLERGKQKQALALADYPELAAFVESIRATLAGDRQALERVYRVRLEGSEARWQLVLEPIEARMARVVQRIEIGGTRDQVRSVEIQQADGDRSVMRIREAVRE